MLQQQFVLEPFPGEQHRRFAPDQGQGMGRKGDHGAAAAVAGLYLVQLFHQGTVAQMQSVKIADGAGHQRRLLRVVSVGVDQYFIHAQQVSLFVGV